MKSFLEEYGLIIVAIIVVAALIALAVTFSQQAKQKATANFETFTEKADTIVETEMNNAGTGNTP